MRIEFVSDGIVLSPENNAEEHQLEHVAHVLVKNKTQAVVIRQWVIESIRILTKAVEEA